MKYNLKVYLSRIAKKYLSRLFPVLIFHGILFAETPADSVNSPPAYFSKGRIENGICLTLYENPALTGMEERNDFMLKYWSEGFNGFGEKPIGLMLFYNKGLGKRKKHSIGITYKDDYFVYYESASLTPSYTYKFKIGNGNYFRIGIGISWYASALYWNKLTFGDMIDKRYGYIYPTKESKGIDARGSLLINSGFWYTGKRFFSGLSFWNMTRAYEGFIAANQYRKPAEIYFTGGYSIPAGEQYCIIPSLIVKKKWAITTISPCLSGTFRNKFLLGFSYKNLNMVTADAGALFFNNLKAVFSIGISNDFRMLNFGTIGYFETSIRYTFGQSHKLSE